MTNATNANTTYLLLLLLLLLWDKNTDISTTVSAATFAAKKKPNNKKNKGAASSSNKGFGAKPAEVFADVVSSFRTRLPENALDVPCPCCQKIPYRDCCAPYHNGERLPETPTKVLQSRYSAFCYRLIPYVIGTTHPICRDWRENKVTWAKDLNREGMFDSYEFAGLEDISDEDPPPIVAGNVDNRTEVFLEFKVRMRAKDSSGNDAAALSGKETVVSEKSRFLRDEEGKWLYASGDVKSEVQGLQDTVLNQ